MQSIDILEQLRVIDPICERFATEIFEIEQAYQSGKLSQDERQYLLSEMMEVRVAQECAGNEIALRHIINACSIIMKFV